MNEDRSKEILNYLAAITRDIGEFRAETKARFDRLEARVNNLETHFDKLEARMERLEARMEKLEVRMERFEGALDDMRRGVRLLNHKFGFVSEETAELRADDRGLRKRVEAVEKKVGITDDV